jgi:hypothetical protein
MLQRTGSEPQFLIILGRADWVSLYESIAEL